MSDNGSAPLESARLARRSNGLPPEAPEPGQLILVTGGAGYIGCVLTERLLDRGYRVRILDRLVLGARAALARARPRRAGRGRRPRHARVGARRRRRRHPPRGAVERPDRRVRPRGELADERDRDRDARAQLHRARRRAPRVRVVVLALRRPAARDARRDRRHRAARRVRDVQALRRAGAAGPRRRRALPRDPPQRDRLRLQPADALRPRGEHVRQGRAAPRRRCPCTAAAGCGARSWTSGTSPTR